MARLTKSQSNRHQQAEDYLWGSDKPLTEDEAEFVLTNWQAGAVADITYLGAFFTPLEVAEDLMRMCPPSEPRGVVDICAGIGTLMYAYLKRTRQRSDPMPKDLVAIELNPAFAKVGIRLMPEVRWYVDDVLNANLWGEIGDRYELEIAFSNPPFLRGCTAPWLNYEGELPLMVAEIACRYASTGGIFIMPDGVMPWRHPGPYRDPIADKNPKYEAFRRANPAIIFGYVNGNAKNYDWGLGTSSVEFVDVFAPNAAELAYYTDTEKGGIP